jgi:hypothetical protein
LRSKKIAFKDSQVIWYTGCDKYTPDLLIGRKLIVEVDGKVHDKDFQRTPDRIRQRALENMGYDVLRVKNAEIQNTPDAVAEVIIQRYFEVVDDYTEERRRPTKITELENPLHYEPIPKEITNDNLRIWALSFNRGLTINDCLSVAKETAKNRYTAVRTSKMLVNKGMDAEIGTGLQLEIQGWTLCFAHEDRQK